MPPSAPSPPRSGRGDHRSGRGDDGQGSVEFVALLPLLALLALALLQAGLAGFSAWSASTAARAGARAAAVGRDPSAAVRRSAPIGGAAAVVRRDGDTLHVRLPVPSVLPIGMGSVAAVAHLEAQR